MHLTRSPLLGDVGSVKLFLRLPMADELVLALALIFLKVAIHDKVPPNF